MNWSDIIRDIMVTNDMTYKRAADVLGMDERGFYKRFSFKDMTFRKINEMLNAFGYAVELVPIDAEIEFTDYEITNDE